MGCDGTDLLPALAADFHTIQGKCKDANNDHDRISHVWSLFSKLLKYSKNFSAKKKPPPYPFLSNCFAYGASLEDLSVHRNWYNIDESNKYLIIFR